MDHEERSFAPRERAPYSPDIEHDREIRDRRRMSRRGQAAIGVVIENAVADCVASGTTLRAPNGVVRKDIRAAVSALHDAEDGTGNQTRGWRGIVPARTVRAAGASIQ